MFGLLILLLPFFQQGILELLVHFLLLSFTLIQHVINNVLYIKNRRRSIYSCITLILKIESHYWEKMRWKSLASLSKVRENKILASFVLNLRLFIFFSCLYTLESGKDVPHAAIFWKCTPRHLYHNRHHPSPHPTPRPPRPTPTRTETHTSTDTHVNYLFPFDQK